MANLSTIAAISTPPGRGALAVVRVSGPDSTLISSKLGLPAEEARVARHATLRHPVTGQAVDDVVAVRFSGPASYTGEDMLEISCHGGTWLHNSCWRRYARRGPARLNRASSLGRPS